MRALRTLLALAISSSTALPAMATTPVRLSTSAWTGGAAQLSFQLTSNNKALTPDESGSVIIYDFQHNGRTASPTTLGGALTGDLVLQLNPAYLSAVSAYSPDGNYFGYTYLGVNFDSLGTEVRFSADLSAFTYPEPSLREEFAFYVLDRNGSNTLFPTGDPLGVNALFVMDALDPYGYQLSVFAPAVLVPPDSVVLEFSPTAVEPPQHPKDRLWLGLKGPNPASGPVRLGLRVPEPGAHLVFTVHDAAGRRIRRLADRFFAPGDIGLEWDGRDDTGRRAAAGVYWIVAVGEGQSVSRKVVRLK
jgi:flagellar hook capping protein FlgD